MKRSPSPASKKYRVAPAASPAPPVFETPTHSEILEGLPLIRVFRVAEELDIAPASMAQRIGVSRSTFHRKRKTKEPLSAHESDALTRHSQLMAQAVAVFDGDVSAARQWLSCPQIGLGGMIPLDLVRTTVGFREVEKLLTRINYGVYA
jgi:putative toxin-antitoxin system antitoxin component (TIGR02293 family)